MPVFRTCCTFLCLQLGAARIHDDNFALVQDFSQIRSAQLLTEDEDEDLSGEKPAHKAAKAPPQQAPLDKAMHAANRAGVMSNMTTDASLVAEDEDDAMRLYNMKEETQLGEIPHYGCVYNVTPDGNPDLIKLHAPGVLFRYAARMEAVVPHAIARWGLSVAGWDTGTGFIKLPGWQHRYLPLKYDGKPVLHCTDDWSPGSFGGYKGGTMAYSSSNMMTLGPDTTVPVEVLRRGSHSATYDVKVTVPGMPSYDVPDVPVVYLNPPPHPVPTVYKAKPERAGKNITLKIKFPDAITPSNVNTHTIDVSIMDNVGMNALFDEVCNKMCDGPWDCYRPRRPYMCRKRSTFVTPKIYVEQKVIPEAVIYPTDTAYDLYLTDGAIVTCYLMVHPPVPDPL